MKKAKYFHHGALASSSRRQLPLPRAIRDAVGVLGLRRAAGDGEFGHRPHRGQSLATKAMAAHSKKIIKAANLARGMLLDGKKKIVGLDAIAIVTHANGANAAVLKT